MPGPFDLILFDADGTLLDFAASERVAFQTCIQAHIASEPWEDIYRAYTEVGLPLWRALEQGTLTLLELRDRRWTELARRCTLTYAVEEISLRYIAELKRQAHLIEGAAELCQALARSHQLGIVTNGFEEVQLARFAAAALLPYIDFIVTSEGVGAHKPAPAIYQRALELARRPLAPERVLMVGDNFECDILGAQRMGFSTVWYNPRGLAAPSRSLPERGAAVDHQIAALSELLPLVATAG